MSDQNIHSHLADNQQSVPALDAHTNIWSEMFTVKTALAASGAVAAAGLAVRFAPTLAGEALVSAAKKEAVGISEELVTAAGSLGKAAPAAKIELASFASIKPNGRAYGALSDTAEAALQKIESTPGMVAVSQNSWLARTYDGARHSVVGIESALGRARGSGFFIDSERNLLATDHHVIDGLEGEMYNVKLHDGRSLPARVIGFDAGADVAVLKLAGGVAERFEALQLDSPLKLASKRAAGFGFPQTGDGAMVVSPGRFTHAAFTDHSRLYFDMKTYFGQSGGPILGRNGKVVSMIKNGVEAGEHSAPETIGSNIEHLRSLLGVVRDRPVDAGPLAVDSQILERGRKMFSAKEIFELRGKPELAVLLDKDLTVKVVETVEWQK